MFLLFAHSVPATPYTADGAGAPHTLQFSKDVITLRRGGREGAVLLRQAYRTDFKVWLYKLTHRCKARSFSPCT